MICTTWNYEVIDRQKIIWYGVIPYLAALAQNIHQLKSTTSRFWNLGRFKVLGQSIHKWKIRNAVLFNSRGKGYDNCCLKKSPLEFTFFFVKNDMSMRIVKHVQLTQNKGANCIPTNQICELFISASAAYIKFKSKWKSFWPDRQLLIENLI